MNNGGCQFGRNKKDKNRINSESHVHKVPVVVLERLRTNSVNPYIINQKRHEIEDEVEPIANYNSNRPMHLRSHSRRNKKNEKGEIVEFIEPKDPTTPSILRRNTESEDYFNERQQAFSNVSEEKLDDDISNGGESSSELSEAVQLFHLPRTSTNINCYMSDFSIEEDKPLAQYVARKKQFSLSKTTRQQATICRKKKGKLNRPSRKVRKQDGVIDFNLQSRHNFGHVMSRKKKRISEANISNKIAVKKRKIAHYVSVSHIQKTQVIVHDMPNILSGASKDCTMNIDEMIPLAPELNSKTIQTQVTVHDTPSILSGASEVCTTNTDEMITSAPELSSETIQTTQETQTQMTQKTQAQIIQETQVQTMTQETQAQTMTQETHVTIEKQAKTCPILKYNSVTAVINAPEDDITIHCKVCSHCTKMNKVIQLRLMVDMAFKNKNPDVLFSSDFSEHSLHPTDFWTQVLKFDLDISMIYNIRLKYYRIRVSPDPILICTFFQNSDPGTPTIETESARAILEYLVRRFDVKFVDSSVLIDFESNNDYDAVRQSEVIISRQDIVPCTSIHEQTASTKNYGDILTLKSKHLQISLRRSNTSCISNNGEVYKPAKLETLDHDERSINSTSQNENQLLTVTGSCITNNNRLSNLKSKQSEDTIPQANEICSGNTDKDDLLIDLTACDDFENDNNTLIEEKLESKSDNSSSISTTNCSSSNQSKAMNVVDDFEESSDEESSDVDPPLIYEDDTGEEDCIGHNDNLPASISNSEQSNPPIIDLTLDFSAHDSDLNVDETKFKVEPVIEDSSIFYLGKLEESSTSTTSTNAATSTGSEDKNQATNVQSCNQPVPTNSERIEEIDLSDYEDNKIIENNDNDNPPPLISVIEGCPELLEYTRLCLLQDDESSSDHTSVLNSVNTSQTVNEAAPLYINTEQSSPTNIHESASIGTSDKYQVRNNKPRKVHKMNKIRRISVPSVLQPIHSNQVDSQRKLDGTTDNPVSDGQISTLEQIQTSNKTKVNDPVSSSQYKRMSPDCVYVSTSSTSDMCQPSTSASVNNSHPSYSMWNKNNNVRSKSTIHRQPNTGQSFLNAPVFKPTAKEFKDPVAYFQSIMATASKFGICKVVPPKDFAPACELNDEMMFNVYNQYVTRLFSRWGPGSREMSTIKAYLASQSVVFKRAPLYEGMEVNLPKLYQIVQKHGGLKKVIERKRWSRVAEEIRFTKGPNPEKKLDQFYVKYLLPYDTLSTTERGEIMSQVERAWCNKYRKMTERAFEPLHRQNKLLGESESSEEDEEEGDCSDDEYITKALTEAEECVMQGRRMNLTTFKKVASNALESFFTNMRPTTANVEEEYWRLVLLGSEHMCVFSASIDTGTAGYGFTSNKNDEYGNHPWNLKNLANNTGNILRYLGSVLGVTVPTLHLGMVFSTSCWHRDPHGLPWMEFMHSGPPKIWYGIPDEQSRRFRKAVESLCPTSCQNKTIWLPSDIAMIPPNLLREQNVTLSRVEQCPGEYIIVCPKAYSCSISTGFTVSESVYFAPKAWLHNGLQFFLEAQISSEPTMISIESLLIAIVSDVHTPLAVLQPALSMINSLLEAERCHRLALEDELPASSTNTAIKHLKHPPGVWNVRDQDECEICRKSLFLSRARGLTRNNTSLCLEHAVSIIKKKSAHDLPSPPFQLDYYFTDDDIAKILKIGTTRLFKIT